MHRIIQSFVKKDDETYTISTQWRVVCMQSLSSHSVMMD